MKMNIINTADYQSSVPESISFIVLSIIQVQFEL